MKYRTIGIFLTSLFAIGVLTGCKKEADANFVDMTAQSIYGQLSNFKVDAKKAGHKLTFTATPSDYYKVKPNGVTNNGEPCTLVKNNEDGSQVYQTTLKAGENKLMGTYQIKPEVDIVAEYKMPVSNEVFKEVMDYDETGQKYGLDFRRAGIEKMQAPLNPDGTKSSAFFNCIDGDTTHAETANLGYTVKMRYLSINTPESTSEIEEWGLTASYYNKFIFTGDEDCLKTFPAADKAALMARPHGATAVILLSSAVAKHETVVDDGVLPEDDDDDDLVNSLNPTRTVRAGEEEEEEVPEVEPVNRPIEVSDLMIDDTSDKLGPFHAGVDGYGRSLCYVWYATTAEPTKDDFRCLNLEMVYQGLSLGIGSRDATSIETYKMFAAADDSAKANYRHIYSGAEDTNYYYYNKKTVSKLDFDTLYKSALNPDGSDADSEIKYRPDNSIYANKKTLYRVEGYVSQKVGTSFYIQEKAEYNKDLILSGDEKAYGIYVFTLRKMPIKIGDFVSVIGAINYYSGTFQMQGVSYHLEPDYNRDTLIGFRYDYETKRPVRVERATVKPISISGAQFQSLRLPSVLVEITDNVYFYDFQELFKGKYQPLAEGGTEEINGYNPYYPFYNTNNNPYVWAKYSANETKASLDEYNLTHRDGNLRYSNELIRIVVNKEVLLSDDNGENCYSYRFLTGGSYDYNPNGAEYANYDPANKYKEFTITKTFEPKVCEYKDHDDGFGLHGLIAISHGYESTGTAHNRKMSLEICSSSWGNVRLTEVKAA